MRTQEIDDIEKCDNWICSQMIRFAPQSDLAKHQAHHVTNIECKILVDGKNNVAASLTKRLKLSQILAGKVSELAVQSKISIVGKYELLSDPADFAWDEFLKAYG